MINLPLSVVLPRKKSPDKKFILNLNNYRNLHYQILNDAKVRYKDAIREELAAYKVADGATGPFTFRYKLFPKSRRLTDLGNVLSIVQKFTEDAMVEIGLIPDDNYLTIDRVVHDFGAVDKDNPRVELVIERTHG